MARTNKKKKHLGCLIALIVLLLLILTLAIGILYLMGKINTVPVNMENVEVNNIDTAELSGTTNVAIFGVDSRESDLNSATRSDTIIICSLDNKTKEVKLVSVYRDTLADVDGTFRKINAAYAKGSYELALSTLNKQFDLDLKDFITVDFSAVTSVVNKIGGIEIKVESDELDAFNKNIKDCNKLNNTDSPLIKKAGTYTLDGTQALAYARIRKTKGSDFRRTKRQRTVIEAILKKAKDTSIVSLLGIINDMASQIATSYNGAELALLAKDIGSYKITDQSGFPFKYRDAYVNRAAVLVPDTLTSNVIELHKFLYGTENYTPSETVKAISKKVATY